MKNREFREAAARQTRGNIFTLFLVSIAWVAVMSSVGLLHMLAELVDGSTVALVCVGFLVFLLGILLAAVMQYGMAENQSRMFKKEQAKILAGFSGFNRMWISVSTYFMTAIYLMLWFLIPIAGLYFIFEKYYAYSCAFFIIQDNESMGSVEAITASKRLIDGRKIRMFCLDVYYFFVWYLGLGIVTFGIAWIWGIPRHMQARYNLYQEAKKEDLLRVKGGIAS